MACLPCTNISHPLQKKCRGGSTEMVRESSKHIDDIPLQVVTNVLGFLNFDQRKSASLVSKRWYEAANAPNLRAKIVIKMSASEDDWDTLGGITKRKIPNLTICFDGERDRISPTIAHHTELASHIKHLCLYGVVHATSVIFSRRHFVNLSELSIVCEWVEPEVFFASDDSDDLPEQLTASLEGLPCLVFEHMNELESADVFGCLSGPEQLFLRSFDGFERLTSSTPMNGDAVLHLLTTKNLAQNLVELDLRHFYVSHSKFRDIMSTTGLKIHTLKFTSYDGGGHNLEVLANSELDLRSLEMKCEGQECFDIRFAQISSLISRKPCLNELECRSMKYPWNDGGDHITRILREWPKIDKLVVPFTHADGADVNNAVLSFSMKQRFLTLQVRWPPLCDSEGIQMLVEHSPGLQILDLCQLVKVSDCLWMSFIARSLSNLTELRLNKCDLKNVSLGALGVSPRNRGNEGLLNLKVLRVRNCKGIQQEDFRRIRFPRLRHLWLTNCTIICDDLVRSVVSHNPGLQLLGLGESKMLTNCSVEAIAQYLKHLRCLLLTACTGLTEQMAYVLTDGCPMLEYVNVTGCDPQLISALLREQRSAPFLRKVKGARTIRRSSFGDNVAQENGDHEEWENI